MISTETAGQLIDFNARLNDKARAKEQLKGSVALYNILSERGVAYLADEVGMGKTFVALGTLALFRHFKPNFRVCIIAPRENIQRKWMKELQNFISFNISFPDLRVKGLDGRPARKLVKCDSILSFVRETSLDPNRDFFLRLTSFSLPLSGKDKVDPVSARRMRDGLRAHVPWMSKDIFDLRNKQDFKDNYARALCCALPKFDLVIIDEGHNLKRGFTKSSASRNRVLSLAFGHPDANADKALFPGYGPRAQKVLFLSATPIEETYAHLWNQLDVFGRGGKYQLLTDNDVPEDEKKEIVGSFLLRRVTSIKVNGEKRTKNLYRREWRRGGVLNHDSPIEVNDPRQRMTVALIQKKVSELLGNEKFNSSFQIGMLASFESFLETAKLKREDEDSTTFDNSDQTDDRLEKEGIDVHDINRISKSYRKKFGRELPHPKMDAVVENFTDTWESGEKSLIFVRRVASVKELKQKLDDRYDEWLISRLRRELPRKTQSDFSKIVKRYHKEKIEARNAGIDNSGAMNADSDTVASENRMGMDTFFAWFFRGDGPKGVISGATVQRRFISSSAVYATFFEENHVASILDCKPGDVVQNLADELWMSPERLKKKLQRRSIKFLPRDVKRLTRIDQFKAAQAVAIELLKESDTTKGKLGRVAWNELFTHYRKPKHADTAPDLSEWLELPTFFTELRLRKELFAKLLPESQQNDHILRFREQFLRSELLAAAARLGQSFIDMYILTIRRLGSLEPRAQDKLERGSVSAESKRINEYLDLLEGQMRGKDNGEFRAFKELSEIASHFDLIIDVNEPDVRNRTLTEAARVFGTLLGQQQPVGGMSGKVNATLVRQFRMPGYPFVLITTDLLQEGEDLHTFCSAVYHYGISWTSSSMEQRIGRIDRVRSLTDRRLSSLERVIEGKDMLQVFYPYLEDTVELLQVQRVLERMNTFLRLMHEGLTQGREGEKKINLSTEMLKLNKFVPQIKEILRSSFPVRDEHLNGDRRSLESSHSSSNELISRFNGLASVSLPEIKITWEPQTQKTKLLGTRIMGDRQQPFMLSIHSFNGSCLIHCVSPVGEIDLDDARKEIEEYTRSSSVRVVVTKAKQEKSYDLGVESDVLLADSEYDRDRVAMLITKTTDEADELELKLLPGRDQPLSRFERNLMAEEVDENES